MIARIQKAMKEKDGGFTLVELIVVVLIIGVLAAIAVPVFMNQSTKAKKSADVAELSNAKIAISSYLAEGNASVPSQADLVAYGGPPAQGSGNSQTHTYTVTNWSATTPTYTLTMANGAAVVSCTATATAPPSC